jgi:hypothetical protein
MSFVCLHRARIFTWFGHSYIHLTYHLLLLVLLVLRVLQLLLRLLVLLLVVVLLLLLLLRVASSCSGVFHPYPPPSILPLAPPPLYSSPFVHHLLSSSHFGCLSIRGSIWDFYSYHLLSFLFVVLLLSCCHHLCPLPTHCNSHIVCITYSSFFLCLIVGWKEEGTSRRREG